MLNAYGDKLVTVSGGYGVDIASQRADELDGCALQRIRELVARGIDVAALDAAGGLGAQAIRMAQAGASATVLDHVDLGDRFRSHASSQDMQARASFILGDLRTLRQLFDAETFDVICCQRTIHYFRWTEALAICRDFAALLKCGGELFLSASGLGSELSQGYDHSRVVVSDRFCNLASAIAEKHRILEPVCLYAEAELNELCLRAGFEVKRVWSSAFGNVKLHAEVSALSASASGA